MEFRRYIHNQTSPALVWIINHNLGEYPKIELFAIGGNEIDAEIVNVSTNQARVYFNIAIAGSARCI